MQNRNPSPLMAPRRAGLPGSTPASALSAAAPVAAKSNPHQELFAAVARQFGLDDTVAAEVSSTGVLSLDGRTVLMMPLPERDDGRLGTLLILETGCQRTEENLDTLLGHAPGVLASFHASLGLTPQGQWVLYRVVLAAAGEGRALADALVGTTALCDFIIGRDAPAAH